MEKTIRKFYSAWDGSSSGVGKITEKVEETIIQKLIQYFHDNDYTYSASLTERWLIEQGYSKWEGGQWTKEGKDVSGKELHDKLLEWKSEQQSSPPPTAEGESEYQKGYNAAKQYYEELLAIASEQVPKGAFPDVIELVRSFNSIVERKGRDTNWDALDKKVKGILAAKSTPPEKGERGQGEIEREAWLIEKAYRKGVFDENYFGEELDVEESLIIVTAELLSEPSPPPTAEGEMKNMFLKLLNYIDVTESSIRESSLFKECDEFISKYASKSAPPEKEVRGEGMQWVKAEDRLPGSGQKVFWKRSYSDKSIYTGFDSFDNVKYMVLHQIEWLDESAEPAKVEGQTLDKWERPKDEVIMDEIAGFMYKDSESGDEGSWLTSDKYHLVAAEILKYLRNLSTPQKVEGAECKHSEPEEKNYQGQKWTECKYCHKILTEVGGVGEAAEANMVTFGNYLL